MDVFLIYLLAGAVAGLIAGLFGVGGGLIVVPVLVFLFTRQGFDNALLVHLAVGTSLASIVFTSISSVYAHHRHGAVLWGIFWKLTPGIVLGALLGAAIADWMPSIVLRRFFALFEWLVAFQLLFNTQSRPTRVLPGRTGLFVVGNLIGTISSIVGIGGGTMTVPFLIWCNVVIQKAVATSSAVGLPIAIAGAAGFMVMGWDKMAGHEWSQGYIYLPALLGIVASSVVFAPLGARLAHHLPADKLRRLFGIFLMLLGVYMFFSA